MSGPRMCFRSRVAKNSEVWSCVLLRFCATTIYIIYMVKECMDPVTCMLSVMLPILHALSSS